MERKKKIITGITAVLLALLILFSLFAGLLGANADDRAKLKDLNSQLSGITKDKNALKSQISELKTQMNTLLAQKAALEQEINLTYEQIEITEDIIAFLDESIAVKTEELAAAEADERRQYEAFKARIRTMYEKDSLTTLELIFTAGSLTEYLARVETESSIASYDKKLIKRLSETRDFIADLKSGLENDRAEAETQRDDLITYKRDLVVKTVELDFLIEDITSQTELAQAELNTVAAEEAAFEKEIAALAAKIAKEEAAAAAKNNASKYTGGVMTWPLPGYYDISSGYSMRNHPITGKYSQHTGIDIPAPKGTKIVAAASGTVVSVGYNAAYGNRVVISHGGGIQTLYAHMSSFAVKENQEIKAGETVGYVGLTGYTTGYHLHFSVLKDGSYVNPNSYLQG